MCPQVFVSLPYPNPDEHASYFVKTHFNVLEYLDANAK